MRIFHGNVVFMLGPEANHYIWSRHAENFRWREGHMGDLMPLLGDGLLTIDGDFHRRSRRIMLPAFHRERIAAARATMDEEIEPRSTAWRAGDALDLYAWTRELALRIAMRALFGLDPDARRAPRSTPPHEFEAALGFYGRATTSCRSCAGPARRGRAMQRRARRLDALIYAEIRPPARDRRARRGHPQPAARRAGRGRRAPRATSTSATRS